MSTTSDRNDPRLMHGADSEPAGQADVYLVDDGPGEFVRPVRAAYVHTRGCGAVTRMNTRIAETYARDPQFYGSTYCTGCHMHRPVAEFDWEPAPGETAIPLEQLVVGS